MTAAVDFHTLRALLDGRALVDVVCPWCGPDRRAIVNQRRKVLRLWASAGFVTYHCARCGEHGYVHGNERRPVNRDALQRARAMTAERERIETEHRRIKALGLWRGRLSISGTVAETYLRSARGITCRLPATLGYLPPRGEYPPAMIAAFGVAAEPEPGIIAITETVCSAVHITRLKPDGSGKADTEPNKVMIGRPSGWPICIAPPNDLLGLAITEGIEDALSVHQATGLGAWAAGSASFLPKLSAVVPNYIETVTIYAHADKAGKDGAHKLTTTLRQRGIEVIAEGIDQDG